MRIQETRSPFAALLSALVLALPAAAETQNDGKIVIKAGTVITQAGEPIENGTIVIENGRITAVGADLEVPWDAEVLDVPGLVAFPGFVEAHSNRGMDRANENIDVTPYLSVRDSIDPVNFYFEDSLRWGVLTINVQQGEDCVVGAQGLIVKPWGMTVEEMLVRPAAGVKLSAEPKNGKSRATQMQVLRQTFADLRRSLEELVRDRRDERGEGRREALFQGRDPEDPEDEGRAMQGSAWTVEGLEGVPRREIDEKLRPLLDLVEGRLPAWFHCAAPVDVHRALEIARENGFLARTTLVLEPACWKAADVIAEAGVPVVLLAPLVHVERDVRTGEEIETFVPGVLKEKGVRFALSSEDASTRSLWFQAALATGLGLSREEALEAVTTVPAELLNLGKRVGSLEVGKDGNVVLFSGDPLDVTSWVEHVVLEGNHVYDRSKDVRAKHLLDGTQPPGSAAASAGTEMTHDPHGDPHDDEVPPEDDGDDDADDDDEEGEGDGDDDEGGDQR